MRPEGRKHDAELARGDGEKDQAAVALGRKGGMARAKALSPEKRAEIARKAAAKRWNGRR
jgi:general stress protein YciG